MDKLTELVTNMAQDLKQIKSTTGQTNSKVEDIGVKLDKIGSEHEQMKEDIDYLIEENKWLRSHFNDLEQYSRKPNIIVSGIPVQKDEDLYNVMKTLGKELEVTLQEYDIVAVHRLPSKSDTPPIIVRLLNYDKKSSLISGAKRLKPKTDMLGINPPVPIYISEHLSYETAKILKYAQNLRKDNLIRFAWVKDGKVLVRVKEDSPVVRMTSVNDINHLQEKLQSSLSTVHEDGSDTEPVAANTRNKKSNKQQLKITNYAKPKPSKR
ncbi:uncharacterized protein LOC135848355 [Planococcus citri]|uniref:uncharacterized protein LOC135848355 n=1 Tax=Planococcus citri TaxID=170843 RepID=UPI0031F9BCA7